MTHLRAVPGTGRPFRLLVTGSRDWDDAQELRYALIHAATPYLPAVVLVHGACPTGADALAAEWASDMGIPAEEHPAAEAVALGADLCISLVGQDADDESDCASLALAAGVPVRRVTS